MPSETTSSTPARSAGPLPSRTAVAHTLPATRRPGGRALHFLGPQLGERTRLTPRGPARRSALASRLVLVASCVALLVVVAEAWIR